MQNQMRCTETIFQPYCFLPRSDTVGWVTGRTSNLQKLVPLILKGSLLAQVEQENQAKGEPDDPVSPGKWLLQWSQWWFKAHYVPSCTHCWIAYIWQRQLWSLVRRAHRKCRLEPTLSAPVGPACTSHCNRWCCASCHDLPTRSRTVWADAAAHRSDSRILYHIGCTSYDHSPPFAGCKPESYTAVSSDFRFVA